MTEQQQPNELSESVIAGAESNANEQTPNEPVDVKALAQQAAEAREQAQAAQHRGDQYFEVLKLRTLEAATAGLLHATSDMPDDDERYYDDNGFPSLDGMRSVAEELIQQKPYLSVVRGDIKQAPQQTTPVPTWSDVLRQAVQ